ncbi:hypothetical protein ABZP36_029342 [Zizania latifolia]
MNMISKKCNAVYQSDRSPAVCSIGKTPARGRRQGKHHKSAQRKIRCRLSLATSTNQNRQRDPILERKEKKEIDGYLRDEQTGLLAFAFAFGWSDTTGYGLALNCLVVKGQRVARFLWWPTETAACGVRRREQRLAGSAAPNPSLSSVRPCVDPVYGVFPWTSC